MAGQRMGAQKMGSEKGFTLVETLVALALFAVLGVGFLSAMHTGLIVLYTTDERQTAKNLAEMQMEYVKVQDFATSYTAAPIPPEYSGYSANVATESGADDSIQKITVTIERQDRTVITLVDYRTGW